MGRARGRGSPRFAGRRVDPSLPRSGNVRSYLTRLGREISCISALSTNNVHTSLVIPTTPGVQAIPRLVIACYRSLSFVPTPPSFHIYISPTALPPPPLTNCAKTSDGKFPLTTARVVLLDAEYTRFFEISSSNFILSKERERGSRMGHFEFVTLNQIRGINSRKFEQLLKRGIIR